MMIRYIYDNINDIILKDRITIFRKLVINNIKDLNESGTGIGILFKKINTELLIWLVDFLDTALQKTQIPEL